MQRAQNVSHVGLSVLCCKGQALGKTNLLHAGLSDLERSRLYLPSLTCKVHAVHREEKRTLQR